MPDLTARQNGRVGKSTKKGKARVFNWYNIYKYVFIL